MNRTSATITADTDMSEMTYKSFVPLDDLDPGETVLAEKLTATDTGDPDTETVPFLVSVL